MAKSSVAALLRKIPGSVRCGAHEYVIRKNPIPEHKNNWGELDTHRHVITIETNTPNGKRLAETLLHECMHGIWGDRYLPGTADEEHVIEQLAAGTISLFVDNPWMLPWLLRALRS